MIIEKMQTSLAEKAKRSPEHRFEDLYGLISDEIWLTAALDKVLHNKGANTPGVDGMTKSDIQMHQGLLVSSLVKELKEHTYEPQPVRRVLIPKANGKMRPLGIPTLRDRVVQEAVRMVLEPIMESHFLDCSTGFRPNRRAMDAIHLATYYTSNKVKMWWMIEGDIEGCFDNIPHKRLLGVLRQYLKDAELLKLIQSYLAAGYVSGGKLSTPNKGVPQGGIVSPLLANIYLHEMDKYWHEHYGSLTERAKTKRRAAGLGNVQLVRYADDFLLMTNGNKAFAQDVKAEFARFFKDELGLTLSADKTHLTHLQDGLDFLGFHLERVYSKQSAKNITLVTPSVRSVKRFKDVISQITDKSTIGDDVINKFKAINMVVNGWAAYYQSINSSIAFNDLTRYVHLNVYYWLKAKHANVSSKGSVANYVLKNYLRRDARGSLWQYHGTSVKRMYTVPRNYYRIKWPKGGNPYLEGNAVDTAAEKVPLPENESVWTGRTGQAPYATARAKKLISTGYSCEECGSGENLHAHHVQAKVDGGSHAEANIKILCLECHKLTSSYGRNKADSPGRR